MNTKNRILIIFTIIFLFQLRGWSQNKEYSTPFMRTKVCFDFDWQFHKGDIAIKRQVKSGGQGGITDINVEVVTKDTIIDYTNSGSYKVLHPVDWKSVNLPHDWVLEGTFVYVNNMVSQSAANGYLLIDIDFYLKKFEIIELKKIMRLYIVFEMVS
jgi:beta-galactosidase